MRSVSVKWMGAKTFDGLDSKGQPVDIDAAQQLGAKPSDLLPMALASCTGYDMVDLLSEAGSLKGLSIEASYIQDPAPPFPFKRIRLHYRVVGTGLEEDRVGEAIRISLDTMCSVAATLRAAVTIESSFEVLAP